ncbi:MAG: type II toxin-antitoxin system YafQ family toxin [Atopobium sp.]|uniref:type II toxin-antitoxin system YafQ family toxin n=1 Tax=Atopobium sp. TaxID=1872650 RepID=UPI002A766752|nr:type II toxin-antitoxin system YafQ family toxin [Atopobium sp.]MDY2788592.1 type II toxin-antitoxin system YafQ family toxin [Atopobium sp.]
MTLKLSMTSQFKKDYKKAKKRGFPLSELQMVIDKLCSEEQLEARYRDHALIGDYSGFRECHVRPDWLLIYAINQGRLILTAARTGTHSDLFSE